MRYVLTDLVIAAVRSLATGVLADPGSQPEEQDLARHVRTLFADADMVPAEEVTEVARYARDRAREGNGSKDQAVAEMADSILTMLALSKLPEKAVLVIGSRSETTVEQTGPVDWQARAIAAESDLAKSAEWAAMTSTYAREHDLAVAYYDALERCGTDAAETAAARRELNEIAGKMSANQAFVAYVERKREIWERRSEQIKEALARVNELQSFLADSEGERELLSRRIAELEYSAARAKEESAASLAHAETHLAARVKAERERTATALELAKVLGERDDLSDSDETRREWCDAAVRRTNPAAPMTVADVYERYSDKRMVEVLETAWLLGLRDIWQDSRLAAGILPRVALDEWLVECRDDVVYPLHALIIELMRKHLFETAHAALSKGGKGGKGA
jgi:hypothetical protein